MTQTSTRLYDDFARLMTDAAGVMQGARREAETVIRSQFERFVGDMDLVKREDFDVVKDMVSRLRTEQETLRKRVTDLEAEVARLKGEPGQPDDETIKVASADDARPKGRRTRSSTA